MRYGLETRRGSPMVALGRLTILIAAAFWVHGMFGRDVARAQSAPIGLSDPATTQALENLPDTPSGVFDESDVAKLPILPATDAPADVQAAVNEMGDAYNRLLQTNRPGTNTGLAVAPDSPKAPPRMDSGDPDPDRVQASPSTF